MKILSGDELKNISIRQMKNSYLEKQVNLVREINSLQLQLKKYYMLCELKVNVDPRVSLINFDKTSCQIKLNDLKKELESVNEILKYLNEKENE